MAGIVTFSHRRRSVATRSFLERPAWILAPTGPSRAVRKRSRTEWMSSSAGWKEKLPSSKARAAASRAASTEPSSSSLRIPARRSARAWARVAATSWGQRRRSKPIETERAASSRAGPSAKRPLHRGLASSPALTSAPAPGSSS
jgi:hypothetical protein